MTSGLAFPHRARKRHSFPGRRWSALSGLLAWWSQARIDRDLAAGAEASVDSLHARRARQLTSPRTLRRIAASIETVIEEANGRSIGMSSEAPTRNRFVKQAEPALRSLVNALTTDRPADPRGVALAVLLLTDTSGPLYTARTSRELTRAALTAAAALGDARRP